MQKRSVAEAPVWTILKVLRWAADYFEARKVDSPRLTAEVLLAEALKSDRLNLYLNHDKPLAPPELARFRKLIQRRARREPVAYILGRQAFWNLELGVTPATLIPRPETEVLVEVAAAFLRQGTTAAPDVLELGTGSGAIILALASEYRQIRCYASDISLDALMTARSNAQRVGLAERVHFFAGDWISAVGDTARFDLILSNPPYIPSEQIARLQPEIHSFEPRLALDGGLTGLTCLSLLIRTAHRLLKPGGRLLLEIGPDQRRELVRTATSLGCYAEISCQRDYANKDRVLQLAVPKK
jgi:release factor glutamine methyltransferase